MTKEASFKISPPIPVTNYRTSDSKVHPTEIDAIAHETFLAVRGDMHFYTRGEKFAAAPSDSVIYEVVMALAKKYEFVPRSAA